MTGNKMKKYLKPLLLGKKIINDCSQIKSSIEYKSVVQEDTKTETLILVPSEKCNLHCKYCYEVEKNPIRMDIELAKNSIRKAFDNLSDNMRLKIEFRGGEPFLEFGFIKTICNWVLNNYSEKDFFFYAVTNGACISNEAKEWLVKYKDIFIVPLSIDGGKKTQDSNRSNSFDLIDFDFFLQTWKNPYTYTTIIPEKADNVFEDLLFLMNKGFTIRANFEFAQLWTEEQLEALTNGLRNLADYTLKNKLHNRLNLFSRYGFLDYNLNDDFEKRKYFVPCNAGKHRRIVAADGCVYPCHTLVPSCFNHYGKEYGEELFNKLLHDEINSDECCQCSFFYLCYICIGFSYSYAKNFKWRNKSFCDITRIRTFVAAYYWGTRLEQKSLDSLSDEEKMLAIKIAELYKGENYEFNI